MQSPNKTLVSFVAALAFLLMSRAGFGQTNNTFPATGNVGIGTTSPTNALEIYGNTKRILIRTQGLPNNGGRPGIIFGRNNLGFFAGDEDSTLADQALAFYSKFSNNRTYNAQVRIYGKATNTWNKYLSLKHDGVNGIVGTDSGSVVLSPATGKVGIGTSTPQGILDVSGYFYTSPGNSIVLRSQASPDEGGQVRFEGAGSPAQRYFFLDNYQGRCRLISQDASGESTKLTILNDGTVGIGITNPSVAYKLSVNGKVKAAEVIVESTWPDFVFADDYPLKALDKVEQYVKVNKHLPEIPSAKEVSENGVAVGEMQAKLLQKIEELTLYVIELKKESESLHQRLSSLEQQRR